MPDHVSVSRGSLSANSTESAPASASLGATAASPPRVPSDNDDIQLETAEDAIRHLQKEFNLTDDQVAQLRADPESWILKNLGDIDDPAELVAAGSTASSDDG